MLLFVLRDVTLQNRINSLHAILKEGLNFIVSGFVEISMKHSSRLIMQFSLRLLIFTEDSSIYESLAAPKTNLFIFTIGKFLPPPPKLTRDVQYLYRILKEYNANFSENCSFLLQQYSDLKYSAGSIFVNGGGTKDTPSF
jgi:hypothetical protein